MGVVHVSEKRVRVYEVFTRSRRGDNLVHIGTVEAESDELAKVYAETIYDEESWLDMCVVCRDDIKWVFEAEGLFADAVERREVHV